MVQNPWMNVETLAFLNEILPLIIFFAEKHKSKIAIRTLKVCLKDIKDTSICLKKHFVVFCTGLVTYTFFFGPVGKFSDCLNIYWSASHNSCMSLQKILHCFAGWLHCSQLAKLYGMLVEDCT